LENLSKHFAPGHFDLIIHTGVFGWGINTRELTERTFEECCVCLRPDGMMIFGWDDVPNLCSFPVIEECKALQNFRPVEFPPVGVHQYLTADNSLRHTFNFFRKICAVVFVCTALLFENGVLENFGRALMA
jgi:SAM-dependent methyltransferase